ncbi:MAG: hypothetical protein MUO21_12295, partial [Nitrososphaeraceae archaeon]|nr:hypothetical protein [Nitrososphaeraceae archaeon]
MNKLRQQNLKAEKNSSFSMKKRIFMSIVGIFIVMLFSLSSASGLVYWQRTLLGLDNVSTTYFAQLTYDETRFDAVTGDKPLEVYALYEAHIPDWNNGSSLYDISLCNLSIYYSKRF